MPWYNPNQYCPEPLTYCIDFGECIDGICANKAFDRVATIQRIRKERTNFALITILSINHDSMSVLGRLSYSNAGKLSQSVPTSIAWSPNDERIVANSTPSGRILVWDVACPGRSPDIFKCTEAYTRLQFHNFDRNILATASIDSNLFLYDIRGHAPKANRPVIVFAGSHMAIRDLEFGKHKSTQNTLITVGDNGSIKFWDIRNSNKYMREMLAHNGTITSISFSNDNPSIFATGGRDKFIRIWDATKSDDMYKVETPSPVAKVVWTNENYDGDTNWHLCNMSSAYANRDYSDNDIYLWDVRRPYMPYKQISRHSSVMTDILFPPESGFDIMVSSDEAGKVMMHQLQDLPVPMQTADVVSVACAFSENECVVATPCRAADFDLVQSTKPTYYGRPVSSQVFQASTGGDFVDARKYRYLAKNYKIVSLRNESVQELCQHNATIANNICDVELARSWEILGILATNDEISDIRPSLGLQLMRRKNVKVESSRYYFEKQREQMGLKHVVQKPAPVEEQLEVNNPCREFGYDRELFEFSTVLEEENCQALMSPIPQWAGMQRLRRRRYVPRMRLTNRDDTYAGLLFTAEGTFLRVRNTRRIHRFFGPSRRHYRRISLQVPKAMPVKRTCVGYILDNCGSLTKEKIRRASKNQLLDHMKSLYDERKAERERIVARLVKRRQKRNLTTAQKAMILARRYEHRLHHENLQWIENNKILDASRTPLTTIQRVILDKSKLYYDRQMINQTLQKRVRQRDDEGNLFKPLYYPNNRPLMRLIFDYYKAQDDVQTVSCMAMCIGERVTMIVPELDVDRWFYFYLETLERFSLFKEASLFMKASYRIQITQLNGEDAFVKNLCCECGKELPGTVCAACENKQFCIICESLVYGEWLICTECGHGGHPDHIRDWFKQHDSCPAPICDHGCFPAARSLSCGVRGATRSGSPTVAHHCRVTLRQPEDDSDFWRYKVPPK